jgi:hypothetical protein
LGDPGSLSDVSGELTVGARNTVDLYAARFGFNCAHMNLSVASRSRHERRPHRLSQASKR